MRWAWRVLALLFIALGLIGAVLPGMPTTVFMLLALWAATHGWPALERWLLEHPRFGPPLHRWREHRAVPRQAKWAAAITMSISAALLYWAPVAWLWRGVAWSTMAVMLLWLCTRPEGPLETQDRAVDSSPY